MDNLSFFHSQFSSHILQLNNMLRNRHGRHDRSGQSREADRILARRRREPSEPVTRLKENNYKPKFINCAKLSEQAEVAEEQPKGN